MKRIACFVIVLLGVLVARADDPGRVRGRAEMMFDPADEKLVVERFESWSTIARDREIPGGPIVGVDMRRMPDDFDDHDLSLLAKLPSLRFVVCRWFGSDEVRALGRLRYVEQIYLWQVTLGADDLKALAPLTRLRSLVLCGSKVSDEGLAGLAELSSLETLELSCGGLTDAGLKHLIGLKRLRRLSLSGSDVGGIDMEKLAALDRLEILELSSCDKLSAVGLKKSRIANFVCEQSGSVK